MIRVRAWLIFYRKIFLYSLLLAVLLAFGLEGKLAPVFLGFAYAVLSPFVHLFFYELGNPQEYYFYANLGLFKNRLRLITAGIALGVVILIALMR